MALTNHYTNLILYTSCKHHHQNCTQHKNRPLHNPPTRWYHKHHTRLKISTRHDITACPLPPASWPPLQCTALAPVTSAVIPPQLVPWGPPAASSPRCAWWPASAEASADTQSSRLGRPVEVWGVERMKTNVRHIWKYCTVYWECIQNNKRNIYSHLSEVNWSELKSWTKIFIYFISRDFTLYQKLTETVLPRQGRLSIWCHQYMGI